ncbi:MFS transporter [Actinoplanes siamensis]|uniref:MFS transporter n=1 Tax=Actinoplanes siamensis TaxID=1223317 RepID=A0A919NA46_9ACTN|nr:MFS transporter [Actinoplanes siamensis]GIF07040.1 MFS transporter [Actinoplanes siamensis]
MDATAAIPTRAGRREFIGLAVLALPTILVSMDISVLYLALPHLSGDLGASSVQQLWITDIYGFMLAGLLVTMGNLGDRIGRKRLLLFGAAGFAVASVIAAYADNAATLIAARALLGVAGSTLMPSIMALISAMFRDPQQHTMAITVWMSCFLGGTALGPIIGGLLLGSFWWGAVFLVAVPIMVLVLALGPALLPEFRNEQAGRLDPLSIVLSLAAILPAVYGLKQITRTGADALTILAIVVGLVCGVLFVRRQNRLTDPLLDLRLFHHKIFRSALLLTMCAGLVAGNQLFVYLYLQSVQQLSPVVTALWLLPSAISMIIIMQLTPLLIRRIRPAYVIAGGVVLAAVGYLMLTQLGSSGNLALVVAALVVTNLGTGPMGSMCAALAMQSAPPERAGSAAAMTSTAGELGIAVSVAVIGSIGNALYTHQFRTPGGLSAEQAAASRESVAGAMESAKALPGDQATVLLHNAFDAITTSLHGTAIASAAVMVGAAVLAFTTLRELPSSGGSAAPAAEPEAEVGTADPVTRAAH